MPSVGYALVGTCSDSDDFGDAFITIQRDIGVNKTTAGCRFYVAGGGGKFDAAIATLGVFC